MANSKFDNQLERMNFLMGYKNTPVNESKGGHVEYHTVGADDKVYGILKEGSMYYIKTTEQGKEQLAESYNYIGGYDYRNENGYKSYNEATKQLELRLMGLNESYGKKLNTSTVDLNRSKKALTTLTEEARKELDRMHQIMENVETIGRNNIGDPESKGKATDPVKQGDPFEVPAKAELDIDPKFNGTVEGATPDNKEVKDVDRKLQSDKKPEGDTDAEEMKDAHDDLEGEGVADKNPKGAKAVKMNEGIELGEEMPEEAPVDVEPEMGLDAAPEEDSLVGLENNDVPEFSDELGGDEEEIEIDADNADSLEDLLREFEEEFVAEEEAHESQEALDGHMGEGDNNVEGEETMDRINEEGEAEVEGAGEKEDKIVGPDEVLDGPRGTMDADTMERLAESICNKFFGTTKKQVVKENKVGKKETLAEAVDRIVAEEITKLDAWGKHPRYQKPAFQTPANKEVAPNDAKDWNDDSVKGDQPYGKKIGDGAPFEKLVDILTDAVKKQLKEGKFSKKA